MMATGDRKDPFRGYNFELEIDGLIRAGFHDAVGLDEGLETTAKQGETANNPRKIPGSHKVGDVTLKRGVVGDLAIWNWYQSVAQGKTERKHGSIILSDSSGEEKIRWNFVNAWPTKWVGPTFNANAKDVEIESLEIAYEGLTRT
jgi:phage tail-like protein